MTLRWFMAACLVAATMAAPATAQSSRFGAAIRVNDDAITPFELSQRTLLLRVLGASGDIEAEARERLIDERLQVAAAEDLGLDTTDEEVTAALEELAGRANLSGAEFGTQIESAGVSRAQLDAFLRAGVLWREVIRTRFGPQVQISEDDVDRAIALIGSTGGARVLLSEIILPARTPEERAANLARSRQFSTIRSTAVFEQTARDFSAAATRGQGGRLPEFLPLSNLPPDLRTQLLTLPVGAVTEPVELPNAVAVFQLRSLEELPPSPPRTIAVDYAEYRVPPGGRPSIATALAEIDTCDDLYGVAKDLPEDRLLREVRPVAEVPADVSRAIANLDDDETAVLQRGEGQVLVMLCGRTTEITETIDRADVRGQLLNQRLSSYADGFLAELRSDAVIVDVQ